MCRVYSLNLAPCHSVVGSSVGSYKAPLDLSRDVQIFDGGKTEGKEFERGKEKSLPKLTSCDRACQDNIHLPPCVCFSFFNNVSSFELKEVMHTKHSSFKLPMIILTPILPFSCQSINSMAFFNGCHQLICVYMKRHIDMCL